VDCAIEASGAAGAFPDALRATRHGGVVSVLSTYMNAGEGLAIPLADWGWGIGDKTIRGSYCRLGGERLSRLLALIEHRRFDPTPMLTHHYSFNDVQKAFDDMAARPTGLVKPLITIA
jgi:threonine dehydrogenase-like Zn-dependent dehydrogenase